MNVPLMKLSLKKLFSIIVLVTSLFVTSTTWAQSDDFEEGCESGWIDYQDSDDDDNVEIFSDIDNSNFGRIYCFEGARGDTIVIYVVADSGDLVPALYLLDEDIEVVDANLNRNEDSYIELIVNLPQSGYYAAVATRAGLEEGNTSGDFYFGLYQDDDIETETSIDFPDTFYTSEILAFQQYAGQAQWGYAAQQNLLSASFTFSSDGSFIFQMPNTQRYSGTFEQDGDIVYFNGFYAYVTAGVGGGNGALYGTLDLSGDDAVLSIRWAGGQGTSALANGTQWIGSTSSDYEATLIVE